MEYRVALECVDHDDNGQNGFGSRKITSLNLPNYETLVASLTNKNKTILTKARGLCKRQGRPTGTYLIVVSNEGSRSIGKHLCEMAFEYNKLN